jgi:tRNA-specific 2-thiouridylase
VSIGPPEDALAPEVGLHTVTWVDSQPEGLCRSGAAVAVITAVAQCSAHGRPTPCQVQQQDDGLVVRFHRPERRVAPGQTVALYDATDPESVLGAGIAR